MKSSVIIKGNKYGFQIVLNPDLPFEELLLEVAKKFGESSGFFDESRPIAVSFQGRELSGEEQNLLIDTIVEASGLRICYIIDGAKTLETDFARAVESGLRSDQAGTHPGMGRETFKTTDDQPEEAIIEEAFIPEQPTEKDGQFYRGTLRSGQNIEVDGSIVILGDINPGANVIAGGNVVVLGCLKGTVTAGCPSDRSAVVAALMMDPMQIKIGDIIARSPDAKAGKARRRFHKKQPELEAKLAFVEDGNIVIEPITRALISELSSM